MSSLFSKDPGAEPPLSPYATERIESEIAHLRKKTSVHDAKRANRSRGIIFLVLIVLGLLWLFFMDPVLYSFKRGDAIKTYLYLHNYGSDRKAAALLGTSIFTASEIQTLNNRQDAARSGFDDPKEAEASADGIIHYMEQLTYLHQRRYENLDEIGKLRYQLFVRWGAEPPTHWSFLDPSVNP